MRRLPRTLFYKGLGRQHPNGYVREHVGRLIRAGQADSFHVTDANQVQQQTQWWAKTMPGVEPHYAVKSNNSMAVLKTLADEGFNFDCASRSEMEQVLSLGVEPERVILSNPCKMESDIAFARMQGVNLTTFDSVTELEKLAEHHPDTDLLLRAYADDPTARIHLDEKAGAHKHDWHDLLYTAARLNLNIRGAMFHIGTGSEVDNSQAFDKSLESCHELFQLGQEFGFNMDTVDIGGGQSEAFGQSIAKVVKSWKEYFPEGIRWLGEPGRCISKPSQTVACRVIGLRNGSVTLNDGVHGSFSGVMQEHTPLCDEEPVDLYGNSYEGPLTHKRLFGPTCDGLDKLAQAIPVPHDIKVGDWLVFGSMGAYSQVTSSRFNGMQRSTESVLGQEEIPLLEHPAIIFPDENSIPLVYRIPEGLHVDTKIPLQRTVAQES